jgi:NADH:ubiquinone oxidoreductase subunit C
LLPTLASYYSALHVRFGSIFFPTQLVDMFAYDLPMSDLKGFEKAKTSDSVVVYNYHDLMFQERFFFFCVDSWTSLLNFNLSSISEIFPNASWLEREVAELNGIPFNNKKDLRNLMLQYGDTTVPFQKASPSIGYKEVFYDSLNDVIVEAPITIQA